MSLLSSSTPSYAEEQLTSHLSALSTLPVTPATQSTSSAGPSPRLQTALHDLSQTRPLTRDKIETILRHLAEPRAVSEGYGVESELDRAMEAEVLARAVTMVWKELLQALLGACLRLEEERSWWESVVLSPRGVAVYLVQTLPHRVFMALPPVSAFSISELRRNIPSLVSLYRPTHVAPSSALNTITSPYTLTRREMLSTLHRLTHARDNVAKKVGLLASQGPAWGGKASAGSSSSSTPTTSQEQTAEAGRVYNILASILEIPLPSAPPSTPSSSSRRSRQSMGSLYAAPPVVAPQSLLAVLDTYLPRLETSLSATLRTYGRPGPLTRLWFPMLFLPPVLWTTASALARNKEWMKAQLRNAKDTVRGFIVSWVWEPLEGIGKTLRGGGEGLGVAPATVKADQESLERMVKDLGRDYYHLSEPQLQDLGNKVRSGDMEEVLRVYEREMQSPLKNALLGSLVRTLLIQVQKTKTDLSLSLLSLDHLLRSQQLTFAFVGVAPSVLVLYGIGGWLRAVWKGEKRGKGRRRQYFNRVRDIERLLLVSRTEQEMSDRERGLLIVAVSGMRTWASGLGNSKREPFLGDLRLIEDPALNRSDKLRVIDRIVRSWGVDGRASR